jgi:hypothetical protein
MTQLNPNFDSYTHSIILTMDTVDSCLHSYTPKTKICR